jgi:hypothetical protein
VLLSLFKGREQQVILRAVAVRDVRSRLASLQARFLGRYCLNVAPRGRL